MTHSITFPWPNSILLPNKAMNANRFVLARYVKAARAEGFYETRSQIGMHHGLSDPVSIQYEFTPPMRRGNVPDDDGMVGMMKPYRDGIADAIGIDDRHFKMEKHITHERKGKGKVVVHLKSITEENQDA